MSHSVSRLPSKTLACWAAFVGGSLGLHRLYLRGLSDLWAWLHWPPTLIGAYGVWRMRSLGQDDRLAWVLIPLLGLMLAMSMLMAIVYGLTPAERWLQQWAPASGGSDTPGAAEPAAAQSNWLTVMGVIGALMVGATVLMATIAFAAQRYFEYEALSPAATQR
jgi:hypothetical protein